MGKRVAFSLVELSIVLVILGLLVGGILAGQSLIRASELRSVSADIIKYRTAVVAFRDKYFGLPGDIANATSFWGAANASASVCYGTSSAGTTATCNGNGDGVMESADGGATVSERFRAWQQLANAGLIEGNFTGVPTTPIYESTPGSNVPMSKIQGVGYSIAGSNSTAIDNGTVFAGNYDNWMLVGRPLPGSSTRAIAFRPEEWWNLDTKIDDGRPAFGTVRMYVANGSACADSGTGSVANYNVSLSAIACIGYVKLY